MLNPISDQQYINAVLTELNLDDDRVLASVSLMWAIHADKKTGALRYLFTKRSAIDAMLAGVWEDIDVGTGAVTGKVSLDQRTQHLQKMRDNVDAEITRLLSNVRTVQAVSTLSEPFIGLPSGEFG